MIRKLKQSETILSAELHLEGMPDDFLPSFGKNFLVQLHAYLLRQPEVTALAYADNKAVNGIILATTDTKSTLRSVMRQGFFMFLPLIILKLITKPRTLKYLWETIFYIRKYADNIAAEILILSVQKKYRHQGVGTQLMRALQNAYRAQGVKRFRVSSLATNKPANNFYLKTGGKFTGKIRIYGRSWNVYQYQFT